MATDHLAAAPAARRLQLRPAHRFPRHAHEAWSFGLIYTGSVQLWSEGSWFEVRRGTATVLPPGEVHEGLAERETGLDYAAVSAPANLVADAVGSQQTPSFDRLVPAARIRRLVAATRLTAPEERRELTLAAVIAVFPDRGVRGTPPPRSQLATAIQRALDEADPSEQVSVRALAERFDVSPPTVIRSFRLHTGMSPYSYLLSRRVDLARRLLDRGMRPGEAALQAGFYDQAHLNRHFVRFVGVPPGSYLQS